MTLRALPTLISALRVAEQGYRTFANLPLERYTYASEAYILTRVLTVVEGSAWEDKRDEWKQVVRREREYLRAMLEDDDEDDPIGPVHGSAEDPCPQAGFHFHRFLPDGRVFTQLNTGKPWHVGMTTDGPLADPRPVAPPKSYDVLH